MELKHLILALIMSSYYFTHSFFLHPPVKKIFTDKLLFSFKAYRIVFNFFAIFGLLIIYWYSKQINDALWIDNNILKLIGALVVLLGIYITYKSFKNYDIKEFIGITAESTDTLQNNLVVEGYHNFVRHPVYLATIIIFIGYFLYSPNWTSVIYLLVTLIYLQIGIFLEESKLVTKFGKSYSGYKRQVPKLLPRKFWR
ncbi:MAG: isoprenylcysteine carboxylmethyltransferase family protein [Flavobacteriales bacterium]|nr:isoprenylcysteine carboxylmethyltransferase family protein [Flavobacteriales bacterium]